MNVVYMPSEKCPKCPFSELCTEEYTCPILDETAVNMSDLKREMRLFAKVKPIKRIIQDSRKGISPVIATVILLGVTIIVSVSIAYWMGGISDQYTSVEIIQISPGSVSKDFVSGVYTINFSLKNTGSRDATINKIYINGRAYNDPSFIDKILVAESGRVSVSSESLNITVRAGNSTIIVLKIVPASRKTTVAPFTAGTTLDINFHAAGGNNPQTIILT